MVRWNEGIETEVLAIFCAGEGAESEVYSSLIHYGIGVSDEATSGKRWNRTSTLWNVADISHLKSMFGAALHILSVLAWPPADILALYCKSNVRACTETEYVEIRRDF